jgi:hypothetical protein
VTILVGFQIRPSAADLGLKSPKDGEVGEVPYAKIQPNGKTLPMGLLPELGPWMGPYFNLNIKIFNIQGLI